MQRSVAIKQFIGIWISCGEHAIRSSVRRRGDYIRPSSASIALMGSKIEARRAAKYGVESVPGTLDPVQSNEEARRVASRSDIDHVEGFWRGGGKGLRFVATERNWTASRYRLKL
jgi:acetyl/propionyl-CoA carboxylase alpha subunit